MSYGTNALAADLDAIGQIAGVCLDTIFPGIQTRREMGGWHVALPNADGSLSTGYGEMLATAMEQATSRWRPASSPKEAE